jgi:uncharacterized membrane protein
MNATTSPRLRPAATILALIGAILAGYLTWVHYDAGALVCGLGNCHTVQSSEFATIGPFPVALLGLGMYLMIVACNVLALARPGLATGATSIAFAVALGGTLYALYLSWLEVAVIGAICQWCVASAIVTILLVILEGAAVWQTFVGSNQSIAETVSQADASLSEEARGRRTAGGGRVSASRGRIST